MADEKHIMTVGELLDLVEHSAERYLPEALAIIARNPEACGLTEKDLHRLRRKPQVFQRFAGALLVQFVNHLARERGGNRGERIEHLA